ncbi:S24 family peptidase [Sphingobacterium sp. LRF_L2]|uniref:S24 family peptidase n=1 Tax=Sphingobacterium sp. LRF_L2 TaxID=3369421 RepID=UPI003F62FB2E
MNWDKLKIVRELLGYSQAEISEKTGIKQKDISLLEGGKRKFIPNEYILFLYNQHIDINSIYDDSLPISYRNSDNTLISTDDDNTFDEAKSTHILHPKTSKSLHANLHPTQNLGLPKVVTVGENERELITLVPVKAAAGYLNGYGDPEYVETLPTIRMPNLGSGTHRAFEIKGSSMNPTFHNKSIVIGKWVENLDEIRDRRIYVVITKDYGIVAKRVLNRIDERGVLTLISDNSNKSDYGNYDVYAEEIKEIWYVRANLSFEFPEPDNSFISRIDDLEAWQAIIEDKIKHLLK